MNLKAVVKLTLLFSACFVGVTLLLIHEHIVGSLSLRGFAVALASWSLGSTLVFVFGLFIFSRSAQSPEVTVATPLDQESRRQRVLLIRLWKGMVALLLLGLVTGLSKARDFPVSATVGAVALNLSMTGTLLWAIARAQKSLK